MVQNEIGHELFGLYAALFSFGLMFMVVADAGVNQYFTKELASKPSVVKSVLPTVFSFKLLICVIYPFFMVFAGYLLGYQSEELKYLFVLSLIQSVLQVILFYRAQLQAFQAFALDSFASVLDKGLLIGIIFIMLSVHVDLDTFIMSRMTASVVAFLIIAIIIFKKFGWSGIGFKKAKLKVLLRGSFPFALIALLFSVHERVDLVMLERLSDEQAAGLYAASYRWVDACMMYLWTILPLFFARFSFYDQRVPQQQKIFNMGLIISNIPIIFICGFVFFYGEQLFWLFNKSTVAELETMALGARILFMAVFVHGFFAIAGTYLTSSGYVNHVNKIVFVTIVINVGLNFLLIKQYGALAAAFSTVVSTAFLSLGYVYYIRKKTPLTFSFKITGILFFNAIVYFASLYLLDNFFTQWYINVFLGGVILVGMSYLTGLVKISGIFEKKAFSPNLLHKQGEEV